MFYGSLEREETIYGAGFNILVSIECCFKVSKTYQINKNGLELHESTEKNNLENITLLHFHP